MNPDNHREFKLEQSLLEEWANDRITDIFLLIECKKRKKTSAQRIDYA